MELLYFVRKLAKKFIIIFSERTCYRTPFAFPSLIDQPTLNFTISFRVPIDWHSVNRKLTSQYAKCIWTRPCG